MEDITDYLINREDSIEYKTNNKNVGSIEEDIKQLKDLIKDRQSFLTGYEENDEIYLKDIKAINNLINDYERQKQINEEHKKLNGELREKVKELEEINKELMNEYHKRVQEKVDLSQELKELIMKEETNE